MNNRLRIAFIVFFAALASSAGLVLLLLATGFLRGEAEDAAAGVMGWCIAGAFLGAVVHGLLQDQFRVEFRRYLLRVMALTTRKGLSLGHAFLALAQDFDGPRQKTVYRILGLLDEGKPLSAALAGGAPKVVPPHVIEAIRAAERSGRLAETLDAAVEESVAARSYRGTVGRSLMYPLMILGIGMFLTAFIVPQIGDIFAQTTDRSGTPLKLPVSMRIVLALGNLATGYGVPLGGALLFVLFLFCFPSVRRSFRWAVDPLLFRIPFLRYYRLLLVGERVCRTLAGYVRTGVTLEEALPQAGAASGSLAVQRSVEEAVSAIRSGVPADRAILALRLPPFVRARAAAATGGTPERFAAALDGLAGECQWRRLRLGELLAGSAYPVTLAFGASIVLLLYFGVISTISKLQGALIPW